MRERSAAAACTSHLQPTRERIGLAEIEMSEPENGSYFRVAEGESSMYAPMPEKKKTKTCPMCDGLRLCPSCRGSGRSDNLTFMGVCPVCRGDSRCPTCQGIGSVTEGDSS
jgi:hypothetical protein